MRLNKQFKNGELPYGLYYCRKGDEIRTLQGEGDSLEEEIFNTGEYVFWHNSDPDVEILDSVPTYEEHMMTKDCAKRLFEAAERETKLKMLLKECREVIAWQTENYDEKPLIEKINEVLND